MKPGNFIKEFRNNLPITLINVFGYSIALSACLIIGLYVYYQFTFDRFHEKSDRIYRLNYIQNQKNTNNATTNHHWFEVLPAEMPGIEKVARFGWNTEADIELNKMHFKANGAFGDKELFDVFSFLVLHKENDNFFEKPNSIALSRSLSTKLFGHEPSLGKTLTLNYRDQYTVTAVFENIPSNSSVQFEYLTSANDLLENAGEYMRNHWLWWMWRTFVLVSDESVAKDFSKNMKLLQRKYINDWHAESHDYYLQPLERIHLFRSSIAGSFDSDISLVLIYILCSAGLLILVISCINFINLSVAGFEARKRSVSIKKIIGASRGYLFRQYIAYSLFLTYLCVLTGVIIALYVIPVLKSHGITGIDIPYENPIFWMILLAFGFGTGLLSGLYPAGYISKTLAVSTSDMIKSRSVFRNSLITIQFSITMILLTAVIIIKKQLNEGIKGDLGYNFSSLISFRGTEDIQKHYNAVHNELRKMPGVIATTSCEFRLPGYLGNYWPVQPEGSEVKFDIFHTQVASNFFEVLKIPLKARLGELREDTARTSDRAVINSEAMRQFNMGEAILGKTYELGETRIVVAAIADDFHIGSMHDLIKPIQYAIEEENMQHIIRLESTDQEKTIAAIRQIWEQFEPLQPFSFHYVDDLISEQYSKEKSLLKIFNLFFALAMVISLVGLFGLVQLLLRFRVKEIGIRKVNGARVFEIMILLYKDFLRWVAIAFVIASPIAWYALHKWLQSFAYKTELSWWVFAAAGMMAMAVALLTVSLQSWRAATRNPVEALRYE
ncbi:MAG: ABC transporter permease [Bacteroidales bacterium]|nr:ABC transporter permease [Bacteroidales bacterium]MBN2762300.1 ABC transporter permease [Bacteroidales bacterium]